MSITRTLDVAPQDADRFMQESDECRAWLRPMLRTLNRVIDEHAQGGRIGALIAQAAADHGMAPGTMRSYYDAYRHSGFDFAAIVNRQLFPDPGSRGALTAEVIALWQRLAAENQRKSKPAWRKLIRMWQAGEPKGMQWPAFDSASGYPAGCTYRNLLRFLPEKFALTAMRQGLGAAMNEHGPMMLGTRVGLYVGSHFVIDDKVRNFKVALLAFGGKTARVQELGVLDVLSGDRFAIHRRPQFVGDDGVRNSVKEIEMRWLLASVFRGTGWSARGTQIVAELGTAAVRKPFADWLHEQSGGKITVAEPGILGKAQALAGWHGRGGGNPRHKKEIESHHNLADNEAADLPAQTGHNRNPPEWLHGIERETEAVLKFLRTMPADLAAAARLEMLEYWQALGVLAEIDQRIALRTDHELEGWLECGHSVVEICYDIMQDLWCGPEQFERLPQAAQDRMLAAVERAPHLRRPRKLAPREVLVRGIQDFHRLADAQLAMFFTDRALGDDLRRPASLNAGGMFEIQDSLASPQPLFYSRELAAREGAESRWLAERDEYQVVQNPFDLSALWVFDARGAFLGTAPIIERAARLDEHAIHAQLARVSHEKAALLRPIREIHADAEKLITGIQEHNRALAAGADPAESRAAKRVTERTVHFGRAANAEAAQVPCIAPEVRGDDAENVEVFDDLTPATATETQAPETW